MNYYFLLLEALRSFIVAPLGIDIAEHPRRWPLHVYLILHVIPDSLSDIVLRYSYHIILHIRNASVEMVHKVHLKSNILHLPNGGIHQRISDLPSIIFLLFKPRPLGFVVASLGRIESQNWAGHGSCYRGETANGWKPFGP